MRAAAALLLCAACPAALAQITADGTAGSIVTRPGSNFAITGGTLAGQNLFHSFTDFGVPAGRTASFSGSASVQNIISRVTGSSASQIDGTLQSTIAGANFYLINPHGVSFGAGAHLDVSGSVHISSADYVRLGASDRYEAVPAGASSFSSATPAAFGFLGAPAALSITGATLNLPAGSRLALAGGDITLSGATINAPAGRVDLASLASAGEILLQPDGLATAPGAQLGAISFANSRVTLNGAAGAGGMSVRAGSLTVTGTQIRSPNGTATPGGNFVAEVDGDLTLSGSIVQFETSGPSNAGTIGIRGGRVVIDGNSLVSTSTVGIGTGGALSISAGEALTIAGTATRISSGTIGAGSGNGGTIALAAPSITVDAALVSASTAGGGGAGGIDVDGGRISIVNHGIVQSSTTGSGNAGNVHVRASESLDISGIEGTTGFHGGFYSTTIGFFATGAAGSISVQAPVLTMGHQGEILSTTELGGGNAGSIAVSVGRLDMSGGARISSSTFQNGRAGSVDVRATDSIFLSGESSTGEQTALRSNSQGGGAAGLVTVQARDLRVENGATISSSAYAGGNAGDVTVQAERIDVANGGFISSESYATGNAGTITVRASDTLRVSGAAANGGIISNAHGTTGNAGSIFITAPNLLMFDVGAIQSVTEATAGGRGGDITIHAERVSLTEGSQIGANTFASGNGGSINVFASQAVDISGDLLAFPSGFFTNSQGASARGNAGAITVQTPLLSIRNSGTLSSNTDGPGNAGTITLRVGDLRLETGGSVSASTLARGDSGTITVIASGSVFISGTNEVGDPSGLFTRSDGRGNGGRISVTAANMFIDGLSGISSESAGRGNAGEIAIDLSGRLEMRDDAQISTQSTLSSGGSISIRARDLVYLRNAVILTEVAQGGGNGGNITIDPQFVVLDHGFIIANAIDGNGGNITIVTDNFLNNAGTITATSQTGISGNIVIRSPVVDTTGALVQLQSGFFDASRLMRESCAAKAGRDASRFLAAPRGGLALAPQGAPQNEGAPRGAPTTSSTSGVRSSCAG